MKEHDHTIIGGPCHGTKIPPSQGFRPVYMADRKSTGTIAHVALRYRMEEDVITVWVPPELSEAVVQDYLNGKYTAEFMKSFDPFAGHFVG